MQRCEPNNSRGVCVEVNENSPAVVVVKEVRRKGPYSRDAGCGLWRWASSPPHFLALVPGKVEVLNLGD